ncbi:MAG: PAS domain S-box protein [Candidatus Omnitrophica bacterium]|nr:PAS domain S-box protein [Candidatus Omnitrophota bacterium]
MVAKPLRILIVEDYEDDALLLINEVKKNGFDPVCERVDEQGLMEKMLDEREWDLLLVDYVMPEFNALKALEVIHERGLDIPFIIVSGEIGEALAVEAMRKGAHDYLMKDNLQRLGSVIDRELIEAKTRREHRQSVDGLKIAKEFSENLLETADTLIVTLNSEACITMFNKHAEDLTGYKKEDVIGRNWFELFIPQTDTQVIPKVFLKALENMSEVSRYENSIILKSGKERLLSWRNSVLRDISGNINGLLILGIDVSERKKAEEEREALMCKLKSRNKEIKQFTYAVSHDLKSPLITIQGYLGYLRKDVLEGEAKDFKSDIDYINNAAIKMKNMLDELLRVSRLGYALYEIKKLSLGNIADEAEQNVIGQLSKTDIKIKIAKDLDDVHGDEIKLIELFQNLLENSIKFMGKQERPVVEVGQRKSVNENIYYVKDNGMGIEPQFHEKIFGVFDKLNKKSEGIGMGLTIVKKIVELHEGRIWVESEGSDCGTTFCFTLNKKKEGKV